MSPWVRELANGGGGGGQNGVNVYMWMWIWMKNEYTIREECDVVIQNQ